MRYSPWAQRMRFGKKMDEIEHMGERKTLPLLGNMFPQVDDIRQKDWNWAHTNNEMGLILWMNEVSDIG